MTTVSTNKVSSAVLWQSRREQMMTQLIKRLHSGPRFASRLSGRSEKWSKNAGEFVILSILYHWGSPGTNVLCELTGIFGPILSPLCLIEDSQSWERFQVSFKRGYPRLKILLWPPVPLRHVHGDVEKKGLWSDRPQGVYIRGQISGRAVPVCGSFTKPP